MLKSYQHVAAVLHLIFMIQVIVNSFRRKANTIQLSRSTKISWLTLSKSRSWPSLMIPFSQGSIRTSALRLQSSVLLMIINALATLPDALPAATKSVRLNLNSNRYTAWSCAQINAWLVIPLPLQQLWLLLNMMKKRIQQIVLLLKKMKKSIRLLQYQLIIPTILLPPLTPQWSRIKQSKIRPRSIIQQIRPTQTWPDLKKIAWTILWLKTMLMSSSARVSFAPLAASLNADKWFWVKLELQIKLPTASGLVAARVVS